MIKPFKKSQDTVDVLVLIIGHRHAAFLADTAESFDHYHKDVKTTYKVAFGIDNNPMCSEPLVELYGHDLVYNTAKSNGWGRGVLRTMVHALDHFKRNGLRWKHLLTVDSDTLIVGPCLDEYVAKIGDKTCFVGQKWGGRGPFSSANPGPDEKTQRQIRQFAKLVLKPDIPWRLVDYMVAGPFMVWTEKSLEFMEEIGVMPGSALDEVYRYMAFPHDQLTTLILGARDHEFAPIGKASLLHCGDVGGEEDWKSGLPSIRIAPYGQIPTVPSYARVIHPIRSKKFDEGKVRAFFRNIRKGEK